MLPMYPAPAPLVDPAETACLETQAERVFAPIAANLTPDMGRFMTDLFVMIVGSHPDTAPLLERLRAGGGYRSGEQLKPGASVPAAKEKAG